MGRSIDLTSKVALLGLCTLLISFSNPVSGIKCWECNSAYDKRCGDTFENITTELVDCDQRTPEMTHLPLKKDGEPFTASVCRKTVQTINEETRVIRSCGWLPNEENFLGRDCFTKTGTNKVMVFHCVCHSDACNGGNLVQFSHFFILFILSISALLTNHRV
ncbi:uncharacterized protein LOC111701087 isoform X2 [Eurytemora carolleeae]|uniref:uncharacterized protein LOC111701087 isoform X2 n=1 Tax=Eurytemora carolleeae TaxID=1294199 RepID=UPI000C7945D5|nr:uncharacterized protein LOC111701087 isoform X2 [Eurytemora carolleeae]|eukprot:XP_023328001.1 uncharacterized protein LOC111701087 isoform X2 [Eurytemora affinis]